MNQNLENWQRSFADLRESLVALAALPFDATCRVLETTTAKVADESPNAEFVSKWTQLSLAPFQDLRQLLDQTLEWQRKAEEAYCELLSRTVGE